MKNKYATDYQKLKASEYLHILETSNSEDMIHNAKNQLKGIIKNLINLECDEKENDLMYKNNRF
jgi:hypothetical protein